MLVVKGSGDSPIELDKLVGANVRRVRQEQSVTLVSLADAVGLNAQKLSHYEAGLAPISAGLLFCISRALDVDIVMFFPGTNAANENESQQANR